VTNEPSGWNTYWNYSTGSNESDAVTVDAQQTYTWSADPQFWTAGPAGSDEQATVQLELYGRKSALSSWQQLDVVVKAVGNDITTPSSSITELAEFVYAEGIPVNWFGGDPGAGSSGIKYDIQVNPNGDGWEDWLLNTTETAATYPGQFDNSYYFRVRSKDNVGHAEAWTNDLIHMTHTYVYSAPAAPINLSASPSTWTNVNLFTISWDNPYYPIAISAAHYKLGTPPTSNSDGSRTTNKPFTVSATVQGGEKLYVWLEAENGLMDYRKRDSVVLWYDGTRPVNGTIAVEGGAATVASLIVTVTNLGADDAGGSGVAMMRLSNNGTDWAAWQQLAVTRTGWDLSLYGGNSSPGTKTVYVQYRDGAGNESSTTWHDDVEYSPNPILLSVRVILEGAYQVADGVMRADLNQSGLLESQFPSQTIPGNAVDSICLEIRNSSEAAASTIRLYAPAWLLQDGTITDLSSSSVAYVQFPIGDGAYYVVVHHRNHLAIMSSATISLNSSAPYTYDFTTSQAQAYGTNPMKELAEGVFGMYAGDADASGDVAALDRTATWNARNQTGYLDADVDLSGDVGALDRSLTWNSRNTSTKVP